MEVYFDNCALQRPLDDQSGPRVRLEAEAVLGLIEMVEAKVLQLVSSSLLEMELRRCPDAERCTIVTQLLALSSRRLSVTERHRLMAHQMVGLKAIDALHLAVAEDAKVPYLCTCDDRFIRAAKRIPNLCCRVVSPLELITTLLP